MMNVLRKYVTQILQDTNGSYSSKRFVTLICVALMIGGFLANLIGNYTVDQFMYESIMYVVIAGLGFSGAENFAPRRDGNVQ